eukprot:TRINITY_DN1028_c1_g1_i1.p1 TRINITY_DN1028_c1_g1~~TRINITY_DN1028_c1_g1_i1.p1  ORF type:complete len:688 (+),score=133.99 TRINITY_DN1028_c1_g1_i1:42-2066(+)
MDPRLLSTVKMYVRKLVIDSDSEEGDDTRSHSSESEGRSSGRTNTGNDEKDKNAPEDGTKAASWYSPYADLCGQNTFNNVAKTMDSLFGLDPLPSPDSEKISGDGDSSPKTDVSPKPSSDQNSGQNPRSSSPQLENRPSSVPGPKADPATSSPAPCEAEQLTQLPLGTPPQPPAQSRQSRKQIKKVHQDAALLPPTALQKPLPTTILQLLGIKPEKGSPSNTDTTADIINEDKATNSDSNKLVVSKSNETVAGDSVAVKEQPANISSKDVIKGIVAPPTQLPTPLPTTQSTSTVTSTAMPVLEPAHCEVLQSVHKGSGLPPQPVPPPLLSAKIEGGGSSFLRKSDTPPPLPNPPLFSIQSTRSDQIPVRSLSCARSESKSSAPSLKVAQHAEGCDGSSCCDEDCIMGVIALTENGNDSNNNDVISLSSTTPSPLPSRSPSANIAPAVIEQVQPPSSFTLSWLSANGPVAFNNAKTVSQSCDTPDSVSDIFQQVLADISEILKPLPTCCDLSQVSATEEIENFDIPSHPLSESLAKSFSEISAFNNSMKGMAITEVEVAGLSRLVSSHLGYITAAAVSSTSEFIATVANKTPLNQIVTSLPPSPSLVVFSKAVHKQRLEHRLAVLYFGCQSLASICALQRTAIMQNIDVSTGIVDLMKVCVLAVVFFYYFRNYCF